MTPIASGFVRVRATRGFYATRQNVFGVVNPGDVVDIATNDARMLRAADKVEFLDSNTDPKLDPNYVPARLKNGPELSPQEKQLALLTTAVEGLTKAFEAQGELLKQALGGKKGAGA